MPANKLYRATSSTIETAPSPFDVSQVLAMDPTYTPGGDPYQGEGSSGTGMTESVVRGPRFLDAYTVPNDLVFGANTLEIQDFLRASLGSTVEVTGNTTISFDDAGTQLDGSTGMVISGTGLFGSFLPGSTIEISGSLTSTVNNSGLHRGIKDCDANQIDIDAGYPVFGGSIAAGDSITIKAGKTALLRSSEYDQYIWLCMHLVDDGTWVYAPTMPNTMTFGHTGQDVVKMSFQYMGATWTETTSNPLGTITANSKLGAAPMKGDSMMHQFGVGGTELLANGVTSYQGTLNLNTQAREDESGKLGRSKLSTHTAQLGITFNMYKKGATYTTIRDLGLAGTETFIDYIPKDLAGNKCVFRAPRAILSARPLTPSGGNEDNKSDYTAVCALKDADRPMLVYQEFAA